MEVERTLLELGLTPKDLMEVFNQEDLQEKMSKVYKEPKINKLFQQSRDTLKRRAKEAEENGATIHLDDTEDFAANMDDSFRQDVKTMFMMIIIKRAIRLALGESEERSLKVCILRCTTNEEMVEAITETLRRHLKKIEELMSIAYVRKVIENMWSYDYQILDEDK